MERQSHKTVEVGSLSYVRDIFYDYFSFFKNTNCHFDGHVLQMLRALIAYSPKIKLMTDDILCEYWTSELRILRQAKNFVRILSDYWGRIV